MSTTPDTDRILDDLRRVVDDAESLLRETSGLVGERAAEVRERAADSVRAARERLSGLEEELVDRARDAARDTEDYVRRNVTDGVVIVSPDAGRVKVAERFAQHLVDLNADVAFVHKRRPKGLDNVAVAKEVIGEVDGRTAGDVTVTFGAAGQTASKTVAVTLFTEAQRTNLAAAFTTIEASIATPIATQTGAGKGDSTDVPFTGRTVGDLFYPATGETDKDGNAVKFLSAMIFLGPTSIAEIWAAVFPEGSNDLDVATQVLNSFTPLGTP